MHLKTQEILNIITQAAHSSAEIIIENFNTQSKIKDKGSHKDIVTETDVASQKNIKSFITAELEKIGVEQDDIGFAEEESADHSVAEHTFIVDPIDGTSNFAAGIPYSCISIGYAYKQKVLVGLVYNPFSKTLYTGVTNEGAHMQIGDNQTVTLQVNPKEINSWMVGVHFNGIEVYRDQFKSYLELYPHVRGLRTFGSLTLEICAVADTSLDAVYNRGCYFWDLAAASVILREAGAELYNYQGEILEFDWQDTQSRYEVVACHPKNKDKAISFLQ